MLDGDTCHLVIIRNGKFERFKSRLVGTSSAELASCNLALKSRDFLPWLCTGHLLQALHAVHRHGQKPNSVQSYLNDYLEHGYLKLKFIPLETCNVW